MEYMDMYKRWLDFDEETRRELEGLDEKEIMERFYKELEFGTGGLRGVIGAGTNRMNVYTVRKATQGLANFILKQNIENPSVAIAYDSRKYSDVFAREAALVLNASGIKTYVYDELKPTPMLSYAVRHMNTTAGIVITASHNPKEYNGYKVYWSDGGQVTEELAEGILNEIKNVDYGDIKTMEYNEAVEKGLFNFMPKEVEDTYVELVKGLTVNKDIVEKMKDKVKVIYTPLHGTGNKPVRRVLAELGYKNVYVVKEQENPDPAFSTVKYPNPEESEVFVRAMEMARELDADVIIGTDPDCDRVGVVVKNSEGNYVVLTGNQTGALLTHYMLENLKATNTMPKNPVVIKTIVTTEFAKAICKDYGVEILDVLTGFKYIGEKIKEFEINGDKSFVLGFEESYGYLAGTFVRDKDAVIASMLIVEMVAYYKKRGMSLYEGLMELYNRYGFYREDLVSITLKGIEGSEKIKKIMEDLRNNPPKKVAGFDVELVKDYKMSVSKNVVSGEETVINLPKSNVIQLVLEDGSVITARPSGTEPKIKFYFMTKGETLEKAEENIKRFKEEILKMAE
ncbi:phospho-sugar mutase [Caloramator proteoclasticus]|uniref:Phosphoglucomutase n=1 Tax=Caloramator proteoclasticus DSM 10124 TaxID=1121262 RepID=A0A1M4WK98_9CLOT|nr:phospho-sugar mutase [Caloramator proteoclasticus]SHE81580.1 phosphoglucomutase [Caloramator proteoclasticus DSM 10124]